LRHSYDDITAAADTSTEITYQNDDDGLGTEDCYTNPYGIMPLEQHGGSYPGSFYNTAGNTITGDHCMSIAVMYVDDVGYMLFLLNWN